MSNWQWSPLELWAGWRAFGREYLPNPLTHFVVLDESVDYNVALGKAADRFLAAWNDDLYAALVIMGTPDARLEMVGKYGPHRRTIRVNAAIRGHTGIVLMQEPGPEDNCGGTIHMMRMPAATVGERVIGMLPNASAGRFGPLHIPAHELRPVTDEQFYQRDSWLTSSPQGPSVRQQVERMSKQPRALDADVCVFAGPDVVDDPVPDHQVELIHVEGDGRYLVHCSERIGFRLEPADAAQAGGWIQQNLGQSAAARVRATNTW